MFKHTIPEYKIILIVFAIFLLLKAEIIFSAKLNIEQQVMYNSQTTLIR